jgi:hypothetical protein
LHKSLSGYELTKGAPAYEQKKLRSSGEREARFCEWRFVNVNFMNRRFVNEFSRKLIESPAVLW